MNGGKKTSKKPASKTLPHGDFHIEYTEYSMWDGASPNTKCVSWLACESGTAVTHAATDAPPSRASPLPQGDLRLPGTPPTFKPASLCNPMICMEKFIGKGYKRDELEYGKQR